MQALGYLLIYGLSLFAVNAELDPERRVAWRKNHLKWHSMANQWSKYHTYVAPPAPPKMQMHYGYKQMMTWKGKGYGGWTKKTYWKGEKGKKTGIKKSGKKKKGMKSTMKSKKGGYWDYKGKGQWKGKGEWKGKGKGKGDPCAGVCSADCIGVQQLLLVDANSNQPLTEIVPGDVLDLGQLEAIHRTSQYAIECVTFGQVASTSVSAVSKGISNIDNTIPFTLSGDQGGNYFPTPLSANPGPWSVTCQPYCEPDGGGETSGPSVTNFDVVAAPPPTPPTPPTPTVSPTLLPATSGIDCSECSSECLFVTGFQLVNADTDNRDEAVPLLDGDVVVVTSTDNFAIECLTDPDPFRLNPWPVGSTFLTDNVEQPGNSENNPPFVLADDNNFDYNGSPLFENPGEWIVSCQAFCGPNQSGDPSNLLTISFTVVTA